MFDWEEGDDRDTVELDPSDDTMSADVEAAEEGETTLRVTAVGHAVAADINITVTKAAKKITLMMGDDEFEVDDSYAPGATFMLAASADVMMRAGSDFGWSSDDSSVEVKVNEGTNPYKAMATVTAKSRGDATITVSYEGIEKSFNVNVIGKETEIQNDRRLSIVSVSNSTFTYTVVGDDDDSDGYASGTWDTAHSEVEIRLLESNGNPVAVPRTLTIKTGTNEGFLGLLAPVDAPADVAIPSSAVSTTAVSTTEDSGLAVFNVSAITITPGELRSGNLDTEATITVTVSGPGAEEDAEIEFTIKIVDSRS